MAHFDRERVPERVVHAKGAGMTISCIHVPTELCFADHLMVVCMVNQFGIDLREAYYLWSIGNLVVIKQPWGTCSYYAEV